MNDPTTGNIAQDNFDPVVPQNFDINKFSTVLDSKFEKLKREISAEESSHQLSSTAKRAKLTPSQFKKEGYKRNEEEARLNDDELSIYDNCECDKDYEYESMLNTESNGVVGRLHRCKDYWIDNFNPPVFVSDILNKGYVIPFKVLPPPCHLKNNRSSLNHPDFVIEAISKLLSTGSVIEHNTPPYVVNPLTVSEGKKLRLVLDLRHVNQYTYVSKFKYEGLSVLADMFVKDSYFFTFDLESGYHHIDIFEPHQKFLGFSWNFGNCVRYFTFSVLPFGLNTASHCFTKMLRPLVTRWRSMGHCSIMYIDDGISGHPDRISALAASRIVRKDLALSGLKVSESKSDFAPRRSGEWLGMIIDTIAMQFKLPNKHLPKTQTAISNCLIKSTQHVHVRDIARIAGFIISASVAIGRLSRLFTRHLYRSIETRDSWSSKILLSPGAIAELQFWYKNLSGVNGQPIKPIFSAVSAIYTDASDSGFGGFSVHLSDSVSSGLWSDSERLESSTSRELRAVLYVLRSLGPKLSGKKLKWYTDSQNACRIISVGSTNPGLHDLSIDLFNCCLEYDICIEPEWLPREFNTKADELSRIIDPDDWGTVVES